MHPAASSRRRSRHGHQQRRGSAGHRANAVTLRARNFSSHRNTHRPCPGAAHDHAAEIALNLSCGHRDRNCSGTVVVDVDSVSAAAGDGSGRGDGDQAAAAVGQMHAVCGARDVLASSRLREDDSADARLRKREGVARGDHLRRTGEPDIQRRAARRSQRMGCVMRDLAMEHAASGGPLDAGMLLGLRQEERLQDPVERQGVAASVDGERSGIDRPRSHHLHHRKPDARPDVPRSELGDVDRGHAGHVAIYNELVMLAVPDE